MSKRKRHSQQKGPPAVNAARNQAIAPEPLSVDPARVLAATKCGDIKTALDLGHAHALARFEIVHGDVVAALERQFTFLGGRLDVLMRSLEKNDRNLAGEPVQIHAAQVHGGVDGPAEPYEEVPPRKWQLKDKWNAVLALIMIFGLMVANYLGFYASYVSADLDLFYQYPYVPVGLAMLAPAAGYAIKAAAGAITDPLIRERYRQGVIFGGIAAFFIYVPLFALQFKGLSGAFDPYAEKSELLAWAFNVAHVFAETLIAGGTFTALQATADSYSRAHKVDNPNRLPLQREDAVLTPIAASRVSEIGELEGRLKQLYGIRDDALNLVETAIYERMNQEPPKGLL